MKLKDFIKNNIQDVDILVKSKYIEDKYYDDKYYNDKFVKDLNVIECYINYDNAIVVVDDVNILKKYISNSIKDVLKRIKMCAVIEIIDNKINVIISNDEKIMYRFELINNDSIENLIKYLDKDNDNKMKIKEETIEKICIVFNNKYDEFYLDYNNNSISFYESGCRFDKVNDVNKRSIDYLMEIIHVKLEDRKLKYFNPK